MLRHWSECESDILQQLMNNADLWDKDIEETEEEYYHASKFCARKLTDDIQVGYCTIQNSIATFSGHISSISVAKNTTADRGTSGETKIQHFNEQRHSAVQLPGF